jgi:hypothetical protein
MTPIDPFEQEIRDMLRRRASDITGADERPEQSLVPAGPASRRSRTAVLASLVVAAALIAGLAILWPRPVAEPEVVVAGAPDSGTTTTNGSVASRSAPIQAVPLIIVPWDLSTPSAEQFPIGFNLSATPVLFSATPSDGGFQTLNNFVAEYLTSRFGVRVIDVGQSFGAVPITSDSFATSFSGMETSERTALYRWTRIRESGDELGGWIYLRKEIDRWGVIAAMSDGVDLSTARATGGSLAGEAVAESGLEFDVYVTTDLSAGCSMSADGLTCNGASQSPMGSGTLDGFRSPSVGSGPVVWVYEIDGGEPLSVTEVAVPSPQSFPEPTEQIAVGWDLLTPSADLFPEGFDLSNAPVLFTAATPQARIPIEAAQGVIAQYFRDRLQLVAGDMSWDIPYPGPDINFGVEQMTEAAALFRWQGPATDSNPAATGWIYLRRLGDSWGVIAATTDGVSLFDLRRDQQQRVAGAAALETERLSMFLEFVDLDGDTLADFTSVPPVAMPTGIRPGLVGGPIVPIDSVMRTPDVVARVILFDPTPTQTEPVFVGVSEAALPISGSLNPLQGRDAVVFVEVGAAENSESVDDIDVAVEIVDSLDMTVRWRVLGEASSQTLYEQGVWGQRLTPAPGSGGYFAILVELAANASVEQLRWEVDWPPGVQGVDSSAISARSSWSLRDP